MTTNVQWAIYQMYFGNEEEKYFKKLEKEKPTDSKLLRFKEKIQALHGNVDYEIEGLKEDGTKDADMENKGILDSRDAYVVVNMPGQWWSCLQQNYSKDYKDYRVQPGFGTCWYRLYGKVEQGAAKSTKAYYMSSKAMIELIYYQTTGTTPPIENQTTKGIITYIFVNNGFKKGVPKKPSPSDSKQEDSESESEEETIGGNIATLEDELEKEVKQEESTENAPYLQYEIERLQERIQKLELQIKSSFTEQEDAARRIQELLDALAKEQSLTREERVVIMQQQRTIDRLRSLMNEEMIALDRHTDMLETVIQDVASGKISIEALQKIQDDLVNSVNKANTDIYGLIDNLTDRLDSLFGMDGIDQGALNELRTAVTEMRQEMDAFTSNLGQVFGYGQRLFTLEENFLQMQKFLEAQGGRKEEEAKEVKDYTWMYAAGGLAVLGLVAYSSRNSGKSVKQTVHVKVS